MIGSILLISSNHLILIISSVFIQIYSILDLVDGNIARQKNLQSNFGMWLDIFFDKLIDFLIIFILSISVYFNTSNENILIWGICLMGIVFSNQFVMVLNETIFSKSRTGGSYLLENQNQKSRINFFLYSVNFYRAHLSLQHNTFLFLVSFFAITNQLVFGIYFLTIHGGISLILAIFANFLRIK